ncbi:lytic murein transglycosylase, partial [Achromobacter aegrifaciens]
TGWGSQPLGVVDLVEEARGTAQYRVGTPNFFALTKYNRSYFYATSVADLASEIEARVGR